MTAMVLSYRGKPLADCTREELIAMCEFLQQRLDWQDRFQQEDRQMEELFASTRVAIRATR